MISSNTYTFNALSQNDVSALASSLAKVAKLHDVIALSGNLGAGKTVFAKAFIRALTDENEDVPSPTFTLVQIYDAYQNNEPLTVWHFDLYRMKTAEEIYETGFEEALSSGISLIEWPEKAGNLLPKNRLTVHIETPQNTPNERNITITAKSTDWIQRMEKVESCLNV